MSCSSPNYFCNTLISIRDPSHPEDVGATGAGARQASLLPFHDARASLPARLYCAIREAFERRRQRRARDSHPLADIGVSGAEAEREAHKPFWR